MVFIHPQSDWEKPSQPIKGPGPKGQPDTWVIHYPGSTSAYEPMSDYEMIRYLQQMQNSYVSGRGYSLGYSIIVSQSGSAWAARGLEGHPGVRVYNPASNPGRKVGGMMNRTTRSIQIAVGTNRKASPAAIATVNAIIATQPDWDVIWHGVIDWTSCAGEGIIDQVKSGVIGHQDTEKDYEMKFVQYRAVDTRIFPAVPFSGEHTWALGAQVPNNAVAVMGTVTVTEPQGSGFISLGLPGSDYKSTSCLNYAQGDVVANTTAWQVRDGQFNIYVKGALTHVVLDIVGYYV